MTAVQAWGNPVMGGVRRGMSITRPNLTVPNGAARERCGCLGH